MKKLINLLSLILIPLLLFFSCKKDPNQVSDIDTVRNNNNKTSYPVTKMDSAQAIQYITKQKIQELLDLSTLYSNGNRDTEIDSIIYAQMNSYFSSPDSMKLKPILKELDSLKVKVARVGNLDVSNENTPNDTLDFAKFKVEYFDRDGKSIGVLDKSAQYTLKITPIQFKKEFKFYFLNFYEPLPVAKKDSTSVGVTK